MDLFWHRILFVVQFFLLDKSKVNGFDLQDEKALNYLKQAAALDHSFAYLVLSDFYIGASGLFPGLRHDMAPSFGPMAAAATCSAWDGHEGR